MSRLEGPWTGRFNTNGTVTISGGVAGLPICTLHNDPGKPARLRAHKAAIEAVPDMIEALIQCEAHIAEDEGAHPAALRLAVRAALGKAVAA